MKVQIKKEKESHIEQTTLIMLYTLKKDALPCLSSCCKTDKGRLQNKSNGWKSVPRLIRSDRDLGRLP